MNLRSAWRFAALTGLLGVMAAASSAATVVENYLYYRDANVPPFQTSREFFSMPQRPGKYEISLISESTGPLTFRIVRVHDEKEITLQQARSYKVGNHEFYAHFDNPLGHDHLIVEIANSNPLAVAKVAVIVVEVDHH